MSIRRDEPVTAEEAHASLTRLVNSHFKNPGEHARMTIPADPRRDDDLLLSQFIDETDALRERALRAEAAIAKAVEAAESMHAEQHVCYAGQTCESAQIVAAVKRQTSPSGAPLLAALRQAREYLADRHSAQGHTPPMLGDTPQPPCRGCAALAAIDALGLP